jgi:hypothetical protein
MGKEDTGDLHRKVEAVRTLNGDRQKPRYSERCGREHRD